MVLQSVWLILTIGPRPVFGYLMISFGFVLIPYGVTYSWMILIVGPRPIVEFLTISYGFLLFSYGVAVLLVGFDCMPSPDLCFSYDVLWVCMLFPWFCYFGG